MYECTVEEIHAPIRWSQDGQMFCMPNAYAITGYRGVVRDWRTGTGVLVAKSPYPYRTAREAVEGAAAFANAYLLRG
ncbi:hypothetical protein VT84_08865 [Gemmata sp. SH-PL17]|nr:hypothetical protein VT84_08865 [Gemmata sp. SH-PL17]